MSIFVPLAPASPPSTATFTGGLVSLDSVPPGPWHGLEVALDLAPELEFLRLGSESLPATELPSRAELAMDSRALGASLVVLASVLTYTLKQLARARGAAGFVDDLPGLSSGSANFVLLGELPGTPDEPFGSTEDFSVVPDLADMLLQ